MQNIASWCELHNEQRSVSARSLLWSSRLNEQITVSLDLCQRHLWPTYTEATWHGNRCRPVSTRWGCIHRCGDGRCVNTHSDDRFCWTSGVIFRKMRSEQRNNRLSDVLKKAPWPVSYVIKPVCQSNRQPTAYCGHHSRLSKHLSLSNRAC